MHSGSTEYEPELAEIAVLVVPGLPQLLTFVDMLHSATGIVVGVVHSIPAGEGVHSIGPGEGAHSMGPGDDMLDKHRRRHRFVVAGGGAAAGDSAVYEFGIWEQIPVPKGSVPCWFVVEHLHLRLGDSFFLIVV